MTYPDRFKASLLTTRLTPALLELLFADRLEFHSTPCSSTG